LFALTGAGYAAGMLGPNTVGTKQLKKNAVISSKVKNHSLLRADFKAGQIPAGPQGPQGPAGTPGAQGAQGPAGPITGGAPTGVTLRGNYTVSSESSTSFATTEISFTLRLGVAPAVHYINVGDPSPAECPGSPTDPQALAGNLCVYEGNATNVTSRGVFNAETPGGTLGAASREGAGIYIFPTAASHAYVWGSWAVTSAGAAASPARGKPQGQLAK
jgi:hypothetical protein